LAQVVAFSFHSLKASNLCFWRKPFKLWLELLLCHFF